MPRIVLHIDRLVLHGVERGDAAALSAALQVELHSLLGVPGATHALTARAGARAVQAGKAALPPGADASALGRAVASRIVGGETP